MGDAKETTIIHLKRWFGSISGISWISNCLKIFIKQKESWKVGEESDNLFTQHRIIVKTSIKSKWKR